MTTFHAVVWLDHSEAHVLMFDREHVEAQRIKSRSHHKHQGKTADDVAFYATIAEALARTNFRDWCNSHQKAIAGVIVDSIAADHPTDAQLVALARQYFKKFDNLAADPSVA